MDLEVVVYRRPNLFEVNESIFSMVGYGLLKDLYTIEGYTTPEDCKEALLYFPERFLNILELRCLIRRLEAAGFESVKIRTGSEHIICTVPNGNLFIVDDELIPEDGGHFKLSNDYVGMPSGGDLCIVGGEILGGEDG